MELIISFSSTTAIIIFWGIALLCISIMIMWRSSSCPNKKSNEKYPPSPSTFFHLMSMINFHRVHDFLTDLARKHKTFRISLFSIDLVYTTDPANVEHILKTNFSNYGKGEVFHEMYSDLFGEGTLTVDGDKWRYQRKLVSAAVSPKNIKEVCAVIFKNNAIKFAQTISKFVAQNEIHDYEDLFMKATMDGMFKIVIGVELDTMGGTYKEGTKFSKAFDKANELIMLRGIDLFWKIKKFLNIGSEALLQKNIKVVDDYVYKLINCKIEQGVKLSHDHDHDDTSMKGDILSRFLHVNETDPKYLKDIILNFIIAAKDTTAVNLSWFVYMLCKHPNIQEIISREVREATNIGNNNCSFEDLANAITQEVLDNLHYLHAALSETLRLYPAIPNDPKMCFSDDTLPDGFKIKKGTKVFYSPYAMGRMKYIWGDDAEDFKPERWLDQNGNFVMQSPFKFTAFQAGPRMCVGKEFAYTQMKIFSPILVGSFRFKLSDEHKMIMNYKSMITLNMEGGLYVHASHRLR